MFLNTVNPADILYLKNKATQNVLYVPSGPVLSYWRLGYH